MIQFKTKPHEEIYNKVKGFLKELFGEQAIAHDEQPVFLIPHGSSAANVTVFPWGDDDATICTRAYVVLKPEVNQELMHYLLKKNNEMRFGAFGLDSEGDVFFEHTIVGSCCDKEELKASVLAVLGTADRYDNEIVERWGGKTVIDM